MKRIISILLTIAMVATFTIVPVSAETTTDAWDGTVATQFAGGDGSEANPYKIANAGQLAYLAESMWDAWKADSTTVDSNIITSQGAKSTATAPKYNAYGGKYFELTADIDLNNKEWTPIGNYAVRFDGIFNGNGHVIKNLKTTKDYFGIGLFGGTGKNSVIKKVGLDDVNIIFTGNDGYTECEDYKAQNVYYNDRIYGAGSLIGLMGGGTVEECYAKNVNIKQTGNRAIHGGLGGFIGSGEPIEDYTSENTAGVAANVKNCYVKDVTITTSASVASAFIGDNSKGSATGNGTAIKFTNCYAGGTVSLAGASNQPWGAATNGKYPASNIHTVRANDTTLAWRRYYATGYNATAESVTTAMTGYMYADEDNTNDGWPVLGWEAGIDVWDGTTASGFGGGDGSENNPYIIATGSQLAYLAKSMWDAYASGTESAILSECETSTEAKPFYNAYTDKYFKLTADINLNSKEWTPIGSYAVRFNGNFDGNGYVISNVKITEDWHSIGFFGATGYKVNISNLGLENVAISYDHSANSSTTVDDGIRKDDDYTGKYYGQRIVGAGGLIGNIGGGSVSNCYVKGVSVKNSGTYAEGGTGGFIGRGVAQEKKSGTVNPNNAASVTNCYVLNADIAGGGSVAPFIGDTDYSSGSEAQCKIAISNCYVGGTITLTNGTPHKFGAMSQYGSGTISKNYTTSTCTNTTRTLGATIVADATAMTVGIVDNENYFADNRLSPINNGWPVLAWEKTWEIVNPFDSWTFANISDEKTDSVTKNLTLPETVTATDGEHTISYTSSNTDVLAIDGTITEPLYDTKVTLTAFDETAGVTKSFTFTILGALTKAFNAGLNGQKANRIKSDITLPSWVENNGTSFHIASWDSNNDAAMSEGGKVGVVLVDTVVKLTANIDGKTTSYYVTVLAKETDTYIDESFDNVAIGTTIADVDGFTEKNGSGKTRENTVDMTIAADPTNPANKVLKMSRFVMWNGSSYYMGDGSELDTTVYNDGTIDSEYVQYTLPEAKTSGKYELSFRMMFGSGAGQKIVVYIPGLATKQNTWFTYSSSQLLNEFATSTDNRKYSTITAVTGKWYDYSMVIDLDNSTYRVKVALDGTSFGQTGSLDNQEKKTLSSFAFASERKGDAVASGNSVYYYDDFKVSKIELSDEDIVEYDAAQLNVPVKTSSDIMLTTEGAEGSSISWASSNSDVIEISADGMVADVKYATEEKTATLTATVVNGEASTTKQFNVTVVAKNYYEIKGFVMADDAEFAARKTITGVEIKNNISKAAKLYVALYNGDRFVDAATADLVANSVSDDKKTVTLDKTIALPDDLTGYEVKAFIWDNATLTPLAELFTSDKPSTTLWLLGDSIMTEYAVPGNYPMTGWGQLFDQYLADNVTVENRAHGGYTTLSYFTESMVDDFTEWEDDVKEGDYAIIGLGINDSNPVRGVKDADHFEELLRNMVTRLQAKGATVILSTPTITLGSATDAVEHGYTVQAVRAKKIAGELGLTVIDLNDVMYQRLCAVYSAKVAAGMTGAEAVEYIRDTYYCWDLDANGWDLTGSSMSKTSRDGTHLNANGAHMIAAMVAELLYNSESKLGGYVNVTTSLWDGSKNPAGSN